MTQTPSQKPPVHYHHFSENKEKKNDRTSGKLYSKAHDIHYLDKNIDRAYWLYKQIIDDFPDSKEAGYAKTQIQNIENSRNLEKVKEEKKIKKQSDIQVEKKELDEKPEDEIQKNKFCYECGKKLDGSPKFCPFCGTKQEES
jgi:rubrerythrin